ncbi:MAG: diguanylate cyclase [Dehalobacterium sp.]
MRKKITLIFAPIIIFTFISVLLNKPTAPQPPKPIEGVLDLSNWSFADNGIVSLKGEWSFYFNQFLTHEDFEKGVDVLPTPIELPSTRKSMAPFKPFPENEFYGTMRLVIKLPEHTRPYGLRTDIVLTSFKLYIDGNLYGEVGKVGTNRENSVPFYNILNTYFHSKNNEVELIYHTSDFTAGDNSIVAPKIGLATQISREEQLGLGRDLFLFGMLLIMGIYHFGLYFMRPKDRAPIYFGVFCLLFSLRMLLVGERFLPSHLNFGFFVYGRIAYLCVFIGFAALCGFLYHALDGLFAKWFIKIGAVLGSLFGFFLLLVPYHWADTLLIAYALFGFTLMGYAIVQLVIGVLKSYPFANIVLFGFTFLGATFVNDFIYQITLANTPSLIPLGVSVFTFTQAYTLSARFSNAFTRAEQLSIENESILSELKHMNSNLESLVEKRTSDLQKALEEMKVMSKTDYLTQLPNRLLMLEKIEHLIAQKKSFYIALVDVDHFKDINDRFGHVKGDEVLIRLSQILSSAVGDCGFVGRWGGEEFLILLDSDQADTILVKANEIRTAVAEYRHEDIEKNVTITIGLCRYLEPISIDILIANADKALYQGKVGGRNQCIIAI